jgi:threonine synthase
MRARHDLSSANSINVGRLLPQMTYFAASSLAIWNAHGVPASYVIPSGNLGHATACLWARRIGLPIGEIVLAHNRNRTLPDYLESGEWRPRPSVATLASAMDVGDPSNGERLRYLFPSVDAMRAAITAYTIDDDAIRARIRIGWEKYGQIWCPHTAAAAEAYARHTKTGAGGARWVIAATAHAAKFPEIVEPLLGQRVPVPQSLASLFGRPSRSTEIEPSLTALRARLA